jgi:hypothetical protein
MKEKENTYIISAGNHEGRRPLGRTRRRWAMHMKKELKGLVSSGSG